MATGRFIRFFNQSPDRQKFRAVVNGYIGDGPARLTTDETGEIIRYTISIPGTPSYQQDWLKHYPHEPTPTTFTPRPRDPDMETAERRIEVVLDDRVRVEGVCTSSIEVITRSQDLFTCAIAEGLVKVLVWYLGGQILSPD